MDKRILMNLFLINAMNTDGIRVLEHRLLPEKCVKRSCSFM